VRGWLAHPGGESRAAHSYATYWSDVVAVS